eukprot:2111383-Pleurochrysis_carterae.AAC.1
MSRIRSSTSGNQSEYDERLRGWVRTACRFRLVYTELPYTAYQSQNSAIIAKRRSAVCRLDVIAKVKLSPGWHGGVSQRSRRRPLSTYSKGKYQLSMAQDTYP